MSTPVHSHTLIRPRDVPLVPCPVRFCFHFLVFLGAYFTNSLLFIAILYLLLETGTATPDDISAMFAIECLAFFAVYAAVVAKQEIDLCCPDPGHQGSTDPGHQGSTDPGHQGSTGHDRHRDDVLSNPLIDV